MTSWSYARNYYKECILLENKQNSNSHKDNYSEELKNATFVSVTWKHNYSTLHFDIIKNFILQHEEPLVYKDPCNPSNSHYYFVKSTTLWHHAEQEDTLFFKNCTFQYFH